MIKFSDIFTFLKSHKILNYVKEALFNTIDKNKDKLKGLANDYISSKSELAKSFIVDFIVNKVKLPFPLNLFKKSVKKTIEKEFDKLVEFINDKIKEA